MTDVAASRDEWTVPNDSSFWVDVPVKNPTLLSFNVDGKTANIDVVNGEVVYSGDLPIAESARALFRCFANECNDWWLERAANRERPAASS